MNIPKSKPDDDIHDKLLIACLEYCKYNEKWETKDTVRSYYGAQRALRKLRSLADEKIKEMRIAFHTDDPRSPLYEKNQAKKNKKEK